MFEDFYLKVFIDKEKFPNSKVPEKAHDTDAAFDIFTPMDFNILPGASRMIETGFMYEIPEGYAMMVVEKSGLATKQGVHIGAKLLDADYRNTVKIHLINLSNKKQFFGKGQKIAQMIILPVWTGAIKTVDSIKDINTDTERGIGGFGSTGQ